MVHSSRMYRGVHFSRKYHNHIPQKVQLGVWVPFITQSYNRVVLHIDEQAYMGIYTPMN